MGLRPRLIAFDQVCKIRPVFHLVAAYVTNRLPEPVDFLQIHDGPDKICHISRRGEVGASLYPLESVAQQQLFDFVISIVVQLAIVNLQFANRQIKTNGIHGSAAGFEPVYRTEEDYAIGRLRCNDHTDERIVLHVDYISTNPHLTVRQIGRNHHIVTFFHHSQTELFPTAKIRTFFDMEAIFLKKNHTAGHLGAPPALSNSFLSCI